jgi:penicillin-binding protein 1B
MPSAKSQKSKPPKKSSIAALIKFSICLILILGIALTAFLVHYYYIFDGNIELKLGKQQNIAETEIYAAPAILNPGKPLGFADLEAFLQRLGYEEASTASHESYYKILNGGRILVRNNSSVAEDSGKEVEIRCDRNSILSITDSATHTELQSYSLKPELLSNAIGKNREKRRFVPYEKIPQVLVNAVLASEDRRFFSHSGIDPIRMLKALIVDIRAGGTSQGASTLTQQFVKNYFLTPERTWRRKFADAYMAILLEKRLSKTQIFELYCNEVYLGQIGSFSIIGFGEAADAFFHKNIKDLTIEEAATLVGIIPAPNRYTPLRYPERAVTRRNLVLARMAEFQMISPSEWETAKSKPMAARSTSILNYSNAPYFVDYVQDQLIRKLGQSAMETSKLKVYTTLNTGLQQAAFESMKIGLSELDALLAKRKDPIAPGTVQASLIAVDPKNGHILALIGGRNYGTSQFDRITESKRQPGSIFKPFVYAAALETASYDPAPLTAATQLLDEPTLFTFENQEYQPKNYKDEYMGQVSMRQAITKSLNNATIKLAERVGYNKVTELAQRLGLNEQIKPYPAMALGSFEITPLEMVRAYTAFANQGLLSEVTPILEVKDGIGNPAWPPAQQAKQVLTPPLAFMVTSLLQSVINNGTGVGARSRGFDLPAAGKTGTSHDGWFAGYTPDLLCIVWVGFDDNRELNLPGALSALPIWTEFMKKAVRIFPLSGQEFEIPEGIVEVEIDPTTGLLATDRCPQKETEYFIQGSEPTMQCYHNH